MTYNNDCSVIHESEVYVVSIFNSTYPSYITINTKKIIFGVTITRQHNTFKNCSLIRQRFPF